MPHAVDDPQWHTAAYGGVPLRDLLARHDIGAAFCYLHDRGISYARIGAATGLTASRVCEIAHRQRVVTDYRVLERIAEGLRIARHWMGLSGAEPAIPSRPAGKRPGGGSLIDHQDLLAAVAAIAVGAIPADVHRWLPDLGCLTPPEHVTAADVETVETVTTVHRQRDAAAGGGACLSSARAYVAWAGQLLHAPGLSDNLSARLHHALADLHNLVGWLAHDLDDHDTARRHLTQSLVLARRANALPLLANGYYRLGRVSLHQRRVEEAMHLFGLGQLVAQQSGCHASVAILHANTAWAYALLGQDGHVVDSLTRARGELRQADPATAPTWTQFALAPADAHGISAVVYGELARHPSQRHHADAALEHAHQAVALRKPQDQRSRIFDHISLAAASILSDDHAAGGRNAVAAVDLAEDGMTSARVRDRLAELWLLARPHADDPEIAAFGRRLETTAV
jgi:tetratricopeptide (TPR) repeat protein